MRASGGGRGPAGKEPLDKVTTVVMGIQLQADTLLEAEVVQAV